MQGGLFWITWQLIIATTLNIMVVFGIDTTFTANEAAWVENNLPTPTVVGNSLIWDYNCGDLWNSRFPSFLTSGSDDRGDYVVAHNIVVGNDIPS